jgi:hypothetical protein
VKAKKKQDWLGQLRDEAAAPGMATLANVPHAPRVGKASVATRANLIIY